MIENFLNKDWSKIHHAYIVSGVLNDSVWNFLYKNLNFIKKGNPDAYDMEYDVLGIDESRILKDWSSKKPISKDGKKVAVIKAKSFTTEAQNALLKLFEEPSNDVYFFIIVPNTSLILKTLLSRVLVINLNEENNFEQNFSSFLKNSVPNRLSFVASILKNKDREIVINFLRFLEREISKLDINKKEVNEMAKKIIITSKYASIKGSSNKMLLENLAISLPNVNL